MPEDEIDRIANRIRNNPSEAALRSPARPSSVVQCEARPLLRSQADAMGRRQARSPACRPYGRTGRRGRGATDRMAQGEAGTLEGGRGRPPPMPGLLSGDDRIWRRAGRNRAPRRRLIERVRHDWLRGKGCPGCCGSAGAGSSDCMPRKRVPRHVVANIGRRVPARRASAALRARDRALCASARSQM